MNWWFGHNVLGLFYIPLALASIYYLLPKLIGRADTVQPFLARFLGAGILLRPGRRTPSDRRAGAGLAGDAFDRAEHDDDPAGRRLRLTSTSRSRAICRRCVIHRPCSSSASAV